jgi:hypothetical protein
VRRDPSGRPYLLDSDLDELRHHGSRDVARSLTDLAEIASSVSDALKASACEREEVSVIVLDDADYLARVAIVARVIRRHYLQREESR